MKTIKDGIEVTGRSYYFLLDWNDRNGKAYIVEKFGKLSLHELNKDQYLILWLHATTNEYNNLLNQKEEK